MSRADPVNCGGFCDLQVNGFAGVDFNNPALTTEDLGRAAAAMLATGVSVFLPTLITSDIARFATCARTLVRSGIPAIAGLHMEGPYIAPGDGPRGAHDRRAVCPAELDDFERRQDAADGWIRLVTLAPEVPGALDLISVLVARGIVVAIGHTDAEPEVIREAVTRGATLSTHLGNGCASVLPRHPNLLWEQLAQDRLSASFIVDGHHLSPSTVRSMVRAKGAGRSLLVTDATAAASASPGEYTIGTVPIRLTPALRVTTADGRRLAGSALTMDAAVGNVVRDAGVSLPEAIAMASTLPATVVGLAVRGAVQAEWDDATFQLRVVKVEL